MVEECSMTSIVDLDLLQLLARSHPNDLRLVDVQFIQFIQFLFIQSVRRVTARGASEAGTFK